MGLKKDQYINLIFGIGGGDGTGDWSIWSSGKGRWSGESNRFLREEKSIVAEFEKICCLRLEIGYGNGVSFARCRSRITVVVLGRAEVLG